MNIEELKNSLHPGELLQRLSIPLDYQATDQKKRVKCPFCRPDKSPSLDIDPDRYGYWKCWRCNSHGDAIDFAEEYLSISIPEILLTIRKDLTINAAKPRRFTPAQRTHPSPEELEQRKQKGLALIKTCEPVRDNPIAKAYFESRGLLESFNDPGLKDIYFHPALDYWVDGKVVGSFPALISLFREKNGNVVAIHRTYLSQDGRRKADVQFPRKYMASWIDPTPPRAIQLFESTADVLIVAEGIETALAVRQLSEDLPGGPYPCFACGDAGLLRKFEIPSGIAKLIIAADNDENNAGTDAAGDLAIRTQDRYGISVSIEIPPVEGTDWNDELNRSQAFG